MTADFSFPLQPPVRALFNRTRELLVLDSSPGRWGRQRLSGQWITMRTDELRHPDITWHLAGEGWIGSRLPHSDPLDRLIIDIDAKDPLDFGSRNERYWSIRRAFGMDSVPLVYGTPTGEGIRVAYRIPKTAYEALRGAKGHGALTAFLNDHGLKLRNGWIEIFPDRNKLDRQMFGRSMPFLCPETLNPLIGARGRPFDLSGGELEAAVRHCEAWYAREDGKLLALILDHATIPKAPKLASHRMGAVHVGRRDPRMGSVSAKGREGHILPLVEGLTAPSTRYDTEFTVGAALWRWPEQFESLHLSRNPSRWTVASALALWLSKNHNGLSLEWSESVDRLGTVAAVCWWRDRYLEPGREDGEAPIDRMARFARTLGRCAPAYSHLTEAEHRAIQLLSLHLAREFRSVVDRYQWEVWTSRFVQVARQQVMRGGRSGDGSLLAAQIATDWMKDWPFGRHSRRYLGLLMQESTGSSSRPQHVKILWTPQGPGQQTATVYQVPWMDLSSALPLRPAPEILKQGIKGMAHHGRPLTTGEAYHALDRVKRGGDLARNYGDRTAKRLYRLAKAARNGGRIVL